MKLIKWIIFSFVAAFAILFIIALIFAPESTTGSGAIQRESSDTESQSSTESAPEEAATQEETVISNEDPSDPCDVYFSKMQEKIDAMNKASLADPKNPASFSIAAWASYLQKNLDQAKYELEDQSPAYRASLCTAYLETIKEASSSNNESKESNALNEVERIYTDGDVDYKVRATEDGVYLESTDATILLGNDCSASSPQYGPGTWSWANGGVLVKLEKKTVGFARHESPFSDARCPMEE